MKKNQEERRDDEPPTLSDTDRRSLSLWAADCAERVLPLFETKAPSDMRVRRAIEGTRTFARGGERTRELRSLAWSAHSAARDVNDAAAMAAARSAAYAAASTFLQSPEVPYRPAHTLASAAYQAYAIELAMSDRQSAVSDGIQWAVDHASQEVLEIVRCMPAADTGQDRPGVLLRQLDESLRLRRGIRRITTPG